jgi:hypothetical protein
MSPNLREFASETNIHFSGIQNLETPSVFVFPKLMVCTDCGFTEFSIPKTELELLARDPPRSVAPGWQKTAEDGAFRDPMSPSEGIRPNKRRQEFQC